MTFQGSFQAEAVPWCPCLEELSMCCLCCIRAEPHPVQQWKHRDLPPVPGAAVCLPCDSSQSAQFWFGGRRIQKKSNQNKKKKKKKRTRTPKKSLRAAGEWRRTVILHLFSSAFVWEPAVIHKWLWQPSTFSTTEKQAGRTGSKSSKKAPKGDGEGSGTHRAQPGTLCCALLRGCFYTGECGTAEPAGGRQGVAVF